MKIIDKIDDKIYSYATLRQIEFIDCIRKHGGNNTDAAKELNVKRQTITGSLKHLIKKAAKMGYSPDHDMTHSVPDGFMLKGTSTLYDSDGNTKIQWVKSTVDQVRQKELITIALDEMCKDIPALPALPNPKKVDSKTMAVYPFGDPHIGLHAWHEDTGNDYDLKIAEEVNLKAMQLAVSKAPPSEDALIVNVGDFFHSDNEENRTQSGHALDVDSRYSKIIRIGVRIMQSLINTALTKHKRVRVINSKGNHDQKSSQWLAVALDARYHDEPRVQIDMNPSEYQYIQFGKVLVGVCHGDKIKPADLESVMASDEPLLWGATTHRYWYTGHVHHDQLKEYRGCKFESFRTLAAKDAWHAGKGYRSGRDLKVIILHKEFGEVERYTIGVDQFVLDGDK
jgi:hypothetical protein